MGEFIVSFLAFGLVISALAFGTIYGKLRLHGSCCGEGEGGEKGSDCAECSTGDCALKDLKEKARVAGNERAAPWIPV